MTGFTLEPLSEDALLLRFGEGIDLATNARVHGAARALRTARLAGVVDVAPAYASLLVRFDPSLWAPEPGRPALARIVAALRAALGDFDAAPANGGQDHHGKRPDAARVVEIPVCYGGTFGPDLEVVAARAGLTADEVVARHTAATYAVAMLGFAPGFPYLLGLDPALHTPRRADPRTRVPAGSVAIGGAQTGIYPRVLPGGWHLIGRTPLTLFRAERDPPALLAAGDQVRFHAIPEAGFERILADQRSTTAAGGLGAE